MDLFTRHCPTPILHFQRFLANYCTSVLHRLLQTFIFKIPVRDDQLQEKAMNPRTKSRWQLHKIAFAMPSTSKA